MILALLAAASAASHSPPSAVAPALRDAARAIDGGRLQEAKLIIAKAIGEGARGAPVERLTADLAFASGNYLQAFAAYRQLARSGAKQPSDCEKGAIAALEIGRAADAGPLADCAVASPKASWRAWDTRGVLADMVQDWTTADQAYGRARRLAPTEARVVNNQGWSMLLRGNWSAALSLFEDAQKLDGTSQRISDNLELAKAALAADLPKRQAGESDRDWAIRLNDAGVAAELLGQRKRAVAAFTQALDASPTWYDRASNNLKALEQN